MNHWQLVLLCQTLLVGSLQGGKFFQFPITSHVTKHPPIIQGPRWTLLPHCWTDWFDRDDPTDTGDWETLYDLRKEYPGKICDKPLKILVLTTGGAPADSTGDTFFYCDDVNGFACRNQDQEKRCTCLDYKVRFLCPLSFCYSFYTFPAVENTFEPITVALTQKTWPTFIRNSIPTTKPLEIYCWTQWFDRDDPYGSGDWENLSHLHQEYPEKICSNPLQIQVLTTAGLPVWSTGDVIYKSDVVTGFICRNSDQKKRLCSDYKVRFLCPPEFCDLLTTETLPTETEKCTTESTTLPTTSCITEPETPTTCITETTPPTTPFETDCWTQWFDRDDPYGSGDWESLLHLHQEYPEKICSNPLQIQVLTTAGLPVWSTGDVIYKSDVVTGFICRNSDQKKRLCSDYKVRFLCPPEFCDLLTTETLPTETEKCTTESTTLPTTSCITEPETPTTCITETTPPTTPFETDCWTQWFDRDDPYGSGDWESLLHLHQEYPEKICSNPLQIQVLTTAGLPVWSTGDVIYKSDVVTGFICRNSDQKKRLCSDYKVRFLCPPEFCDLLTTETLPTETEKCTTESTTLPTTSCITEPETPTTCITETTPPTTPFETDCWTQWFDRDDPYGSGDWESLLHLHQEYPEKICSNPLQIQVLTTAGLPVWSTGDVIYKSDVVTGFICRNSDQKKRLCSDYKVRFLCPPEFCDLLTTETLPTETEKCTTESTTLPTTSCITEPETPTTCITETTPPTTPFETDCWTQWFDRDDPYGSGDWESLLHLHQEYPEKICSNPLQIQVLTTAGLPVWSTGDVIYKSDVVTGFICRNSDQKKRLCSDYKVRFLCPPEFCDLLTTETLPTETEKCTTESTTLPTTSCITEPETPTTCITETTPPTTPFETDCWTQWFDRDDPYGSGDWENLSHLHQEYPEKICSNPLQIQVLTTAGLPVWSTGDVIYKSDVVTGFICRNSDQKKRLCSDYKVRFLCPPEFCDLLTTETLPTETEKCTTESTTLPTTSCITEPETPTTCITETTPPTTPFETDCWTQWFDRDDPYGSGDWENLSHLHQEYPEKICSNPLQIQVLTTAGLPVWSTGDVIYKSDVVTGFICRNSDQKKRLCSDYKVRFLCPPEFCDLLTTETLPTETEKCTTESTTLPTTSCITEPETPTTCITETTPPTTPFETDCWTQWFDRDDPYGSGDWESLLHLHQEYPEKICSNPLQIQVLTTAGLPVWSTGDVIYKSDVVTGFICRNSDQKKRLCSDYKVRFLCPPEFCDLLTTETLPTETEKCTTESTTLPTTSCITEPETPTTCITETTPPTTPFETDCWTQWFDRDDPYGSGDWESLLHLHQEYPEKICSNPLQIQVLTTAGLPVWSTGDVIYKSDVVTGFICRNSDQKKRLCSDYKVRFLCPPEFCDLLTTETLPTETEKCTTESTTLPTTSCITEPETPTTCITETTPPTTPFETDCWTQWFDRDDPYGSGDWESLSHLHQEYPEKICSNPIQIQVLTTAGLPVWSTGDVIYKSDIVTGFICRNSDQKKRLCSDYKVRFLCPPEFCDLFTTETLPTETEKCPTVSTTVPPTSCITELETWLTFITKPTLFTRPFETDKQTIFTIKTWPTLVTKPTPTTRPLDSYCWTQWFDRDNPSGAGDWETLLELHQRNPGKICSKPLQIQVLTTAGLPVWSTGDRIYKSDTVTGFICRNSDQRKGKGCSDYQVRFMCPPKFCIPPPTCWTEWFDRDDPTGTGDWETLNDLWFENPGRICSKPLQIQVQTTSGAPLSSLGDHIYKADTVFGFICRNSDQKKGNCHDYKVRFMCPLDFCVQSNCWTKWFDRDNPSGSGDWETLINLRSEYPEEICDTPLQIQAQTTTGLPASAAGNVLATYDTTVGLICKNWEQRNGVKCNDFQVRFLCPPDFCQPKGCYTEWFDRDDPSGSGDWETLFALYAEHPGLICNNPLQIQVQSLDGNSVAATGNIIAAADVTTGFICKNSGQPSGLCEDFRVRFFCPLEFCQQKVCWTRWFDRDDPSDPGDCELLSTLRKENPTEICKTPLYIDVRTVDTNEPITATVQNLHIYSPTQGLLCRNQDQRGCDCRDYKVRFGCPCKCTVERD